MEVWGHAFVLCGTAFKMIIMELSDMLGVITCPWMICLLNSGCHSCFQLFVIARVCLLKMACTANAMFFFLFFWGGGGTQMGYKAFK